MTVLKELLLALFIPRPVTYETVEAKVENALFDLDRAAKENRAVSKLLNDVLTAS